MKNFLLKDGWYKKFVYCVVYYFSGFFKINYIIGSYASFFSGVSIVMPLSGVFLGSINAGLLCMISLVFHIIRIECNPLSLVVHHLPGFFAAWYLTTHHWLLAVATPLGCIIGFIMHPVGAEAWLYSMYWFIPVILFQFKKRYIYLDTLIGTFIAHAIGSLLWLYINPMSAIVWNGLIPLVLVERLLFATGTTFLYYLFSACYQYVPSKQKRYA